MKTDEELLKEFYEIGGIANKSAFEMVAVIKKSANESKTDILLNQISKKLGDLIKSNNYNDFIEMAKKLGEMTGISVDDWIGYVLDKNNDLQSREAMAFTFVNPFFQFRFKS